MSNLGIEEKALRGVRVRGVWPKTSVGGSTQWRDRQTGLPLWRVLVVAGDGPDDDSWYIEIQGEKRPLDGALGEDGRPTRDVVADVIGASVEKWRTRAGRNGLSIVADSVEEVTL